MALESTMDDSQYVGCGIHGRRVATYVCQHIVQTLRDGQPRGFWPAEAEAGELYPDSWCTECEAVLNEAGEWNDETEAKAGVTLTRSACYERAKALNEGGASPDISS
ncbi:conserved protein of unknown function [Methylocaldum szegediense]|uniref:Integron gene cassette protein n=1 Tax=Methylocaldum szegediense TaxID=73780 RepID=A0ABM9HXK4_9GAMM|nr:conserved protein of unknown function [Methylocaldum szegediense]